MANFEVRQKWGVVLHSWEIFNQLDSGLRRNDAANGLVANTRSDHTN
jgi:hypothetical protein